MPPKTKTTTKRRTKKTTPEGREDRVDDKDHVEKNPVVVKATDRVCKMISWNVAGLRACIRKGDFEKFLEDHNPDIMGLQEVKASPEQVQKAHPECWERLVRDYPYYVWADSKAKKGYAGVALFSRRPFLQSRVGLGKELHDKYGRIITVEYPDFYLVTTYVPNSGTRLVNLDYRTNKWNLDFQEWIKKLQTEGMRKKGSGGTEGKGAGKEVIVSGDLNVAHKSWDLNNDKSNLNRSPGYTDRECAGMTTLLEECHLVDSFRVMEWSGVEPESKGNYSYWSNVRNARAKNIGWRIDYFLVSSSSSSSPKSLCQRVSRAEILSSVMGSDHCPVSLTITC